MIKMLGVAALTFALGMGAGQLHGREVATKNGLERQMKAVEAEEQKFLTRLDALHGINDRLVTRLTEVQTITPGLIEGIRNAEKTACSDSLIGDDEWRRVLDIFIRTRLQNSLAGGSADEASRTDRTPAGEADLQRVAGRMGALRF